MPNCAVLGCKHYSGNTKGTDISYFRFPKSEVSRQWVIACKREDNINLKDACICSVHFTSNCFEDVSIKQRYYPSKNYRNLKPDAIPMLNLPGKRNILVNLESTEQDKKRRLEQNYSTSNNDDGSQDVFSKSECSKIDKMKDQAILELNASTEQERRRRLILSNARRQKEYRMRRKIDEQLQNAKKKTNTQSYREFLRKQKQQRETRTLAKENINAGHVDSTSRYEENDKYPMPNTSSYHEANSIDVKAEEIDIKPQLINVKEEIFESSEYTSDSEEGENSNGRTEDEDIIKEEKDCRVKAEHGYGSETFKPTDSPFPIKIEKNEDIHLETQMDGLQDQTEENFSSFPIKIEKNEEIDYERQIDGLQE